MRALAHTTLSLLPSPVGRIWRGVYGSSLGRRVAGGAFWTLLGAAVARGMNLVATIIVARALGKVAYGQLGLLQSTIGMFGVLAGLGLGTTATKYVAELRSTQPDRVGRIVALSSATSWVSSGLMSLALILAAPWLAANNLSSPALAPDLRIAAVLVLLGGVTGAQTGVLSGLEAFRTIARVNFVVGVLTVPCLSIGVLTGGLRGAIWGLAANLAVNCILNYISVRRELRSRGMRVVWDRFWSESPLLLRFSLPVLLISLIVVPTNWFSATMLAARPEGFAGLGEYSVGLQWRNFIVLVPAMLAQVAMPALSNLRGLRDSAAYGKVLKAHLAITALVAGASGLAVLVFANAIAKGYGREFSSAAPVISMLAVSGILVALNGVVGAALGSLGRAWTGLVFASLCGAALLVAAHYLIPSHGAIGLAVANVIAYALHTVWQGMFLARLLNKIRHNEASQTSLISPVSA